jgi:hypothetical protein
LNAGVIVVEMGAEKDKLNYAKMGKIVRMIFQLSWNPAQQPGRPKFAGPVILP